MIEGKGRREWSIRRPAVICLGILTGLAHQVALAQEKTEDPRTVLLNDTGTLTYPFLGELQVEGLTVGELERAIVSGLKGPYLVDPDVTVSIEEYRSFLMQGEVERPGGYAYQPGLTVEKAVALAGGLTERAARNKIDVTRSDVERTDSKRLKLTDQVSAGDVISVQQCLF